MASQTKKREHVDWRLMREWLRTFDPSAKLHRAMVEQWLRDNAHLMPLDPRGPYTMEDIMKMAGTIRWNENKKRLQGGVGASGAGGRQAAGASGGGARSAGRGRGKKAARGWGPANGKSTQAGQAGAWWENEDGDLAQDEDAGGAHSGGGKDWEAGGAQSASRKDEEASVLETRGTSSRDAASGGTKRQRLAQSRQMWIYHGDDNFKWDPTAGHGGAPPQGKMYQEFFRRKVQDLEELIASPRGWVLRIAERTSDNRYPYDFYVKHQRESTWLASRIQIMSFLDRHPDLQSSAAAPLVVAAGLGAPHALAPSGCHKRSRSEARLSSRPAHEILHELAMLTDLEMRLCSFMWKAGWWERPDLSRTTPGSASRRQLGHREASLHERADAEVIAAHHLRTPEMKRQAWNVAKVAEQVARDEAQKGKKQVAIALNVGGRRTFKSVRSELPFVAEAQAHGVTLLWEGAVVDVARGSTDQPADDPQLGDWGTGAQLDCSGPLPLPRGSAPLPQLGGGGPLAQLGGRGPLALQATGGRAPGGCAGYPGMLPPTTLTWERTLPTAGLVGEVGSSRGVEGCALSGGSGRPGGARGGPLPVRVARQAEGLLAGQAEGWQLNRSLPEGVIVKGRARETSGEGSVRSGEAMMQRGEGKKVDGLDAGPSSGASPWEVAARYSPCPVVFREEASLAPLFRTAREGQLGFVMEVPPGRYQVDLYCAETSRAITAPGQRVFAVAVQGQEALSSIDMMREVGWGVGMLLRIPDVAVVEDGRLAVELRRGIAGEPVLCGLAVQTAPNNPYQPCPSGITPRAGLMEALRHREGGVSLGRSSAQERWVAKSLGWGRSWAHPDVGPVSDILHKRASSWTPTSCTYTSHVTNVPPNASLDQAVQKVLDIRFHPGGRPQLVVGCNAAPNELLLYDLEAGRSKALEGHRGGVQAVEYTSSGDHIVSCSKNIIKVWDASTGANTHTLGASHRRQDALLRSHHGKIAAMALNPTNPAILLTSGKDRSQEPPRLLVWNIMEGKLLADLNNDNPRGSLYRGGRCRSQHSMDAITFISPTHAATGSDTEEKRYGLIPAELCLWDVNREERILCLLAHDKFVTCIDVHPCGNLLVTGAGDGSAALFDIRDPASTWGITRLPAGQGTEINSVSFSSCGRFLQASSTSNSTLIFDLRSTSCSPSLSHYPTVPPPAALPRPGPTQSISDSLSMPLLGYSPVTTPPAPYPMANSPPPPAPPSHRPPPLASLTNRAFRPLHILSHGPPMPHSSPEDRDQAGLVPGMVDEGDQGVNHVAWFHNTSQLVTACGNGSITIWDVSLGTPCLKSIATHAGAVNTVAVSHCDSVICSGGDDQKVVMYQNVFEGLSSKARSWHFSLTAQTQPLTEGDAAVDGRRRGR